MVLDFYDNIAAEYGKDFADRADNAAWDTAIDYTDMLMDKNFYGKTPEEFIRIFGNYGKYVYSREDYLWRLSYLLSGEYGTLDGETYWIGATIDEEAYIDNYLRLSKLQDGESTNRFFKLDEELVVVSIQSIQNKSVKHLSTEELYKVAEDVFLLYAVEETIHILNGKWENFIKRMKYSQQKENFRLSCMLGAIALCAEYGYQEIYWNSWDKDKVLRIYGLLKNKHKKSRREANRFLYHLDHCYDLGHYGTPWYDLWDEDQDITEWRHL